jgi:hypothetical protein
MSVDEKRGLSNRFGESIVFSTVFMAISSHARAREGQMTISQKQQTARQDCETRNIGEQLRLH